MTRLKAGRRRHAVIAGAIAALVVALLASLAIAARPDAPKVAPSAPKAASACANADRPADEATTKQLRKAVRCLINKQRVRVGAGKLAKHPGLRKAAQRHAKVMVAEACLAHECGDEADLETRIRQTGYLDGAKAWKFAENTGCGASAEAMVANWVASREHRLNLLTKRFRELGVGVVGDPVKGECRAGYATFVVVLGWRKPAA